jgi:H+/gluconate symporter-like permease
VNFLPDFTPTVLNAAQKKSGSKTGVIVGVIVGVAVLVLIALAGMFVWIQKRRKLSLEQEGMGYTRSLSILTEQRSSRSKFVISSVMSFRAVQYCGKT